ncbi:MAG: single-stranded DNA-binding protein, partial [Caldilineaceae bacterium]|nr:single-stranded DNA-binding protein [Caldilineaceae bacterium]
AGYKQRRAEQLTQLALRIADQVVESGRSASLEPMPSNERRIIHMALRDHAYVYTQSSGEGDRRKVHIVPKD